MQEKNSGRNREGRSRGEDEVERLIAEDQHQIGEVRMNSTRELQLQRTEEHRLVALGNLQQRLKERQESEEIKLRELEQDRRKKRHQRVTRHRPDQKRKRVSEERNVFVNSGLGRRQQSNGQGGCSQLACSTHKGIS